MKEYQGGTVTLEKELQTVIENNMVTFFGVTFLASEYRTTDGGRMDSIIVFHAVKMIQNKKYLSVWNVGN